MFASKIIKFLEFFNRGPKKIFHQGFFDPQAPPKKVVIIFAHGVLTSIRPENKNTL